MVMAVLHLQPVQPIHAKAGAFIAVRGGPQRHIGLFRQILAAAIIAVIVNDEEMVDPHLPVIAQEKRQAHAFVAQGGKDKDCVAREGR